MGKARRKQIKAKNLQINTLETDVKKPQRKKTTKRRKYRSREVSPSWRPKYGCGRLHWNMRNHGHIDTRRRKRQSTVKKNAVVKEKKEITARCCSQQISSAETIEESCALIETEQEEKVHVIETASSAVSSGSGAQSLSAEKVRTPDLSAKHSDSRMTVDSSTQVDIVTEDKQVSARLIYDDDEEQSAETPQQPEVDDSLIDISNVPDHEIVNQPRVVIAPPPLFPWNNSNNSNSTDSSNSTNKSSSLENTASTDYSILNNCDNIVKPSSSPRRRKTVEEIKRSYCRPGGLPLRKSAMYATIRIHQMYFPAKRR